LLNRALSCALSVRYFDAHCTAGGDDSAVDTTADDGTAAAAASAATDSMDAVDADAAAGAAGGSGSSSSDALAVQEQQEGDTVDLTVNTDEATMEVDAEEELDEIEAVQLKVSIISQIYTH
jgi:hypothetical protein